MMMKRRIKEMGNGKAIAISGESGMGDMRLEDIPG